MARIAGVDLPRTKRVETGLQYIYGIGPHRSGKILAEVKIDPNVRVKDLSEEEVSRIAKAIEAQGAVEGDLRKQVSLDIKRLIEIGSHRGIAAPPQPPGSRTADQDQCAHPQGAAQGRARQEVTPSTLAQSL
jgi:small subunit ribosomal protein S13